MLDRVRWIGGAAGAVVLVALSAGCATSADDPDPSPPPPSPTASASPSGEPPASEGAAEEASPTASASPPSPPVVVTSPAPVDDTPTPVTLGCLDLVSLDTMYDFNPNFSLQQGYAPAAGTPGALAVQDGGVACGWVHASSGDLVEIVVAKPGPVTLGMLRAQAAVGDSSGSATGATVYFTMAATGGTVQAFTGSSWVVATSPWFAAAADAQPLIDAAIAAVG